MSKEPVAIRWSGHGHGGDRPSTETHELVWESALPINKQVAYQNDFSERTAGKEIVWHFEPQRVEMWVER